MPRGVPKNKTPNPAPGSQSTAVAAEAVPVAVTVTSEYPVGDASPEAEMPGVVVTNTTNPVPTEPAKEAPKDCQLSHHIHILEDGLLLAGAVWYRGQDFDVQPGQPEWALVHQGGKCLIDMDARTQLRKFGRQMFAPGPWPFEPYDLEEEALTDKDRERLAKENASRGLN